LTSPCSEISAASDLCGLEIISLEPAAVVVSYRLVLGAARRDDGAPARSKRPATDGRSRDIVLCFTNISSSLEESW